MVYKLILYKSENVVLHCGTIDYDEDVKVGELVFKDKETAQSVMRQLVQQKICDKVKFEQVEI